MSINFICFASLVFGIIGLFIKTHSASFMVSIIQILFGLYPLFTQLITAQDNFKIIAIILIFFVSLIIFLFCIATLIFRKRSTTKVNELTEFRG